MANDPDTSEVQALEPPVDRPERPAEDFSANGGDGSADVLLLDEGVDEAGEVPEGTAEDKVAQHVKETLVGVADEELGRDGGADLS